MNNNQTYMKRNIIKQKVKRKTIEKKLKECVGERRKNNRKNKIERWKQKEV